MSKLHWTLLSLARRSLKPLLFCKVTLISIIFFYMHWRLTLLDHVIKIKQEIVIMLLHFYSLLGHYYLGFFLLTFTEFPLPSLILKDVNHNVGNICRYYPNYSLGFWKSLSKFQTYVQPQSYMYVVEYLLLI